MGVYEENIVPIKISRLAEYMAQKKGLTLDEALLCIYSNPMYKELYDEGAKWWYLSVADLYDEFEQVRDRIHVLNLNCPDKAVVFSVDGEVLETTMDDIELSIARRYLLQNQKYMGD